MASVTGQAEKKLRPDSNSQDQTAHCLIVNIVIQSLTMTTSAGEFYRQQATAQSIELPPVLNGQPVFLTETNQTCSIRDSGDETAAAASRQLGDLLSSLHDYVQVQSAAHLNATEGKASQINGTHNTRFIGSAILRLLKPSDYVTGNLHAIGIEAVTTADMTLSHSRLRQLGCTKTSGSKPIEPVLLVMSALFKSGSFQRGMTGLIAVRGVEGVDGSVSVKYSGSAVPRDLITAPLLAEESRGDRVPRPNYGTTVSNPHGKRPRGGKFHI